MASCLKKMLGMGVLTIKDADKLREYLVSDMQIRIADSVHETFREVMMEAAQKEKDRKRLSRLKPKSLVTKHLAAMEELKQRDAKIERLECDAASAKSELVRERKNRDSNQNMINKITELFPAMTNYDRNTNPAQSIKHMLQNREAEKRDTEEKVKRLLVVLKLFATESSNPDAAEARLHFALGEDIYVNDGLGMEA